MNIDPRFTITSKQVIFIIFGVTVATGQLSLPRAVAKIAQQDGWISIILGALLPLISLLLIYYLVSKFPDSDYLEVNRKLMGKYLGWLPITIMLGYLIFMNSVIIRLFAEVTSLYMLPDTPLWAILSIASFAIFFIARYGVKVVGRLSELLFYLVFSLQIIGLPAITMFDVTNFLPIGETGFKAIFSAAMETAYWYGGIEILLILFFMVQQRKEILRSGLIAVGLSLISFLFWVVICLGVFGPYAVQESVFPAITLLKTKEVFILERMEFVFLLIWGALGTRPMINWTSAGAYLLVQSLGINLKKYYVPAVGLLCLAIMGLAQVPKDINQLMQFSTYAGYSVFAIAVGLPLIYNLLYLFRRTSLKQS